MLHLYLRLVACDLKFDNIGVDFFRLYPEYEQALNNLANVLRDNGDLNEAEALLRRALEIR